MKEQQLLKEDHSKKCLSTLKTIQIKIFNDWDKIDTNKKVFIIGRDRIASDTVVCLENVDAEKHIIQAKSIRITEEKETNQDVRRSISDDVFLSEDEEKEGDDEMVQKSRKRSSTSTKATDRTDLSELVVEGQSSNLQIFKFIKKPSLIESFFNLYDNLPKETLIYILQNQFTIAPLSFLAYCDKKRQLKSKRLKLAKTDQFKFIWLCLTLDLEC